MRTIGRLAIALVLLALLGAGGAYLYLDHAASTPLDPHGADKPGELRVDKGATLSRLGTQLEEQHFIASAGVWSMYVRLHQRFGGLPAPKAGRHPLHPGMNIPQIIERLAENPLSDDVPLTMVEGWRISDADAWMASEKLIAPGAYIKATENPAKYKLPFPFEGKTLEGYLYPETYLVPPGPVDVEKLVQRQIDTFAARFYTPYTEEVGKSGRTLRELVIMASMLEREEPNPAQRPEVAGVLYKRLDARTPLGVDATSRYRLADWNDRKTFLEALHDAEEPYNTRLRAGLPPGPIGAPAVESLVAALRPVKSPYWYYLHDGERKIHFAKTAEEHEANRKRFNVF